MNISLQPWTEEMAPARVPILNHPDVYRFLAPSLPLPYTLEHSLGYVEVCRNEGRHDLAIVVDGTPVGSVGIHPRPEADLAEIGYYLDPARHRQGIMTRAVELMLARVPELMPAVRRVNAHVFDFNPASQALLRRCGFTLTNKTLIERGRDGMDHRLLVFELTLPHSPQA